MDLKELLQSSKQQLTIPLGTTRRRLLTFVNLAYIILLPIFLISEKAATGNFVPHPGLYFVYGPVLVINLFSASYNFIVLYNFRSTIPPRIWDTLVKNREIIDVSFGWASLVSIMVMSFCHMIGFGNPSNDAILTDFALAHSIITLAVFVVGRKMALAWFLIVVAVLLYDVTKLGWNYQYHYLTPQEVTRYETALKDKQEWAMKRKVELAVNRLNPPRVTRYFNTWIIFIIVAFLTAYFFSGISHDIFKIVPSVIHNLEIAIQSNARLELEREREKHHLEEVKRLAEEQKLLGEKEALIAELALLKSQFDPHFLYNTLSYFYAETFISSKGVAEGIMKLSDIMRYSLKESPNSRVPLSEEIHQLNNYIDIHQLRFNHRLHISFQWEGAIESKQILPLVLISFVENAFKHGDLTDAAMPLLIRLSVNKGSIYFGVQNKKHSTNDVLSTGIGLANVKRRLALAYGGKYQLNIEEHETTYNSQLQIDA